MPWPTPLNSRSRADLAGKIIAGRTEPRKDLSVDQALGIVANWRSSHGYPLHVLKHTLRARARKIDKRAVVAQRLKRLPSIQAKLNRFGNMQLTQMQDLGGCRAIVASARKVDQLVSLYQNSPTAAALFIEKYDYISVPKNSGYRSVHLVYRYDGKGKATVFSGLRIEVQIRSALQHAWATALETIDTFTGQALKSDLGHDLWQRFFALAGAAFAVKERRPPVPGTPSGRAELALELRDLSNRLNVEDVLLGLNAGLKILPNLEIELGMVESYILLLDSAERKTEVQAFVDSKEAADEYIRLEKLYIDRPEIQTVMVSVDSIAALSKAYPNYYMDTTRFRAAIYHFLNSNG